MMTPEEILQARLKLRLSRAELAFLLGYGGEARQMGYELEAGRRRLREPQRRLLEAYLAGYRPPDWLGPKKEACP